MSLKGKRVLVTGAGGFLGSHLTEKLVQQDASVRAFLRYTSQRQVGNLRFLPSEVLKEVDLYFGDIRDADAVLNAGRDCDAILHLAANIAIPYSYAHPGDTVAANVMGTFHVLMAAKNLGTSRILVVSTSEVYGTALTERISEQHPLQAQSPYSASKIGAEKLAESFHLSFDLPVTVVRPFNAYGPRQSCRAVVPTIICQLLRGGALSLGDPTPTRDFNFCTDLVEGMLAIVSCETAIGNTLNLGTGQDISIETLAQKIGALMGREVVIEHDDLRMRPTRSEVRRLCCDASKAKDMLDWQPMVSLDDGLRQTIEWFSEHPEIVQGETFWL